jgi:hypothetical protein
MHIWPAADSAPEGYPRDLPFVPRVQVAIEGDAGEGGDVVVMKWWGIERPIELLQLLSGASARDGWVLHDDDPPATGDAGSVRRLRFVRGSEERIVEAVQAGAFSFITLTQRRVP